MLQHLEQRCIGETRRVVAENGAVVELHLVRDADPLPFGHVTQAIVRDKVGGRLKVDCKGEAAWLIGNLHHPLGATLWVQVVRAPVAEPGQIKIAHVIAPPGQPDIEPVLQFVHDFPDSFEIDAWCERAISGHIPFAGGSLALERTRAGLVIDVDGTGSAIDINITAAQTIAAVLRLFQVGGMVMVDFVTPDNRSARLAIDTALDAALRRDPRRFERTAMNGFGMVQIVRSKCGPSLIDQLCGTRRHAPSHETQALALLQTAARSKGAGLRTLTARREIIDYINRWPLYMDELRKTIGADIALIIHEAALPHVPAHVHVMPV
jgi:ribonuclease G